MCWGVHLWLYWVSHNPCVTTINTYCSWVESYTTTSQHSVENCSVEYHCDLDMQQRFVVASCKFVYASTAKVKKIESRIECFQLLSTQPARVSGSLLYHDLPAPRHGFWPSVPHDNKASKRDTKNNTRDRRGFIAHANSCWRQSIWYTGN
jgi:MarR-like DNA-binding transcriptional regulator SgrR of sgrS sRNA